MDGDVAHFTPIARRTIQRMPVDLEKEDGSGGHGKRDHVGRSNSELVRTLSEERLDTPAITKFWLAEGSFNDLRAANRYVNDVLESDPADVDAVASGKADDAFIEKRYNSPTGREAYREAGDPKGIIRLRNTFWVGVYIIHSDRPNGFTVRTAYPMNRAI